MKTRLPLTSTSLMLSLAGMVKAKQQIDFLGTVRAKTSGHSANLKSVWTNCLIPQSARSNKGIRVLVCTMLQRACETYIESINVNNVNCSNKLRRNLLCQNVLKHDAYSTYSKKGLSNPTNRLTMQKYSQKMQLRHAGFHFRHITGDLSLLVDSFQGEDHVIYRKSQYVMYPAIFDTYRQEFNASFSLKSLNNHYASCHKGSI